MAVRYDHRKLAFLQNPKWKKRRVSGMLDLHEPDEPYNLERRGTIEVGNGLLGAGRSNAINAGMFQKLSGSKQSNQVPNKTKRRRGSVNVSEVQSENRRKDTTKKRQKYLSESDGEDGGDFANLSNILEGEDNEEEALQNIMVHLEQKQKKREQEKYGEEFESIKMRMTELLADYSDTDEELDMARLADPDFFVSEETKERHTMQNGINDLLNDYLELCHERTDLLSNVHDALNFEDEVRNLKTPIAEELDNVSSEISMTIEMIQQSSGKLNKLYNHLLKLYSEKSTNTDDTKIKSELRQLDLQKQVISKFKTLHGQNKIRKEKVDTWKYAANEIVDLLKSVRQEGATDFEQLEKEFEKMVSAFTQQTRMVEEHQETIAKQKANIKKIDAMKEKLKNDNQLIQENYDRSRVQMKTMQIKNTKLQQEVQEVQEKLVETEKDLIKAEHEGLTANTNRLAAHTLEQVDASNRVEDLQKELNKVEMLLKTERQKNKEHAKEKQKDIEAVKLDIEAKYEAESRLEVNQKMNSVSTASTTEEVNAPKKKCMKCKSFKTRLEEVVSDLCAKREQIVQLSKKIEEKEEDEKRDETPVQETVDHIQHIEIKTSQKDNSEIKTSQKDNSEIERPPPDQVNSPEDSLNQKENDVTLKPSQEHHVTRTSTKQIIIYSKISMEKQERVDVWDQSTQTDFAVEQPIIIRKRGSVPTHSRISKNFSSQVDDDIKDMATRIYGYVNSIGQNQEVVDETGPQDIGADSKPTDIEITNLSNVDEDSRQKKLNHAISNGPLDELPRQQRYSTLDCVVGNGKNEAGQKILSHRINDNSEEDTNHNLGLGQSLEASNQEKRSTLDCVVGNGQNETNQNQKNPSSTYRSKNSSQPEDQPIHSSPQEHEGAPNQKNVSMTSKGDNSQIIGVRNRGNSFTTQGLLNGQHEGVHNNGNGQSDGAPNQENPFTTHRLGNGQYEQQQYNKGNKQQDSVTNQGNPFTARRIFNGQQREGTPNQKNHSPHPNQSKEVQDDPLTTRRLGNGQSNKGAPNQDNNNGTRRTGNSFSRNSNRPGANQKIQQYNNIPPNTSDDQAHGPRQNNQPINRRGNESGFFDDSLEESKPNGKWETVRAGVVNHVLRFLDTKGKNLHLRSNFQRLDHTNHSDNEIVKTELNVFAEHAIDMLDVISYTVKQMNECHIIPLTIMEEGSMLTKFQSSWEPYRNVNERPRTVKFSDKNNNINDDKPQQDSIFPDIMVTKQKMKKEDEETKEAKAKVAEKKRQKILERHKKLVNKLRQSGVGLKQIYTILGINTADEDEVSNHIIPRNTNRKISLVGHGYRSDVLKAQEYHEKLQRMTGLTMNGTGGVRGYSRRLSTVDQPTKNTSMFPSIQQPKLATKPLLLGSNFFQTRPLTGGGKPKRIRR